METDTAVQSAKASDDSHEHAETFGHKRPVQARARLSMERLVETAMEMLIEGGVGQFNLKALSTRSGVSIGSLYHSFANKKALIEEVQRRVYAEAWQQHQSIIERLNKEQCPLNNLTPLVVDAFASHTRNYAPALRVFMFIATQDDEIRRNGVALFEGIREDYVSIFLERRAEIVRGNPVRAAQACFEMIFSCLSRRLGLIDSAPDLSESEWSAFVEDVATMATLYLTAEV
jgi:AcrR family transcriptional regulator